MRTRAWLIGELKVKKGVFVVFGGFVFHCIIQPYTHTHTHHTQKTLSDALLLLLPSRIIFLVLILPERKKGRNGGKKNSHFPIPY